MSVTIRRPYCTESHADFFTRNITVCKGDLVASAHGYLSQPVRTDVPAVGAAITLPITIEQAKNRIRYTHTTEDDSVEAWIKAAARKVETDTGVVLLTSEWRMHVHAFPSFGQALYLPLYPIQSIDAFTYVDTSGDEQTVFTGSPATLPYIVDYGRPVRLQLADAETWPADTRSNQPGTIEVTAGWTDPELIPDDLIQAMYLLIGQSALFREHGVVGDGVRSVLMDYDRWLEAWRLPGV
jgi:uncharacterized phiE125 gp8 family phage protein